MFGLGLESGLQLDHRALFFTKSRSQICGSCVSVFEVVFGLGSGLTADVKGAHTPMCPAYLITRACTCICTTYVPTPYGHAYSPHPSPHSHLTEPPNPHPNPNSSHTYS